MIKIVDKDKLENLQRLQASILSVSEIQTKRPYLALKIRLFSTRVNANNEKVSESFIDRIIGNKKEYLALPLVADTGKITRGDFRDGLGHMFDESTQTFLSSQIGSFVDFEKVNDEFGVSLIGEARTYKRNAKITDAITTLYNESKLAFSFEIIAGSVTIEDGVLTVGDSEKNELIGLALVSRPAFEEAIALSLVAEKKSEQETEKIEASIAHAHVDLGGMQLAEASLETVSRWIIEAVWKFVGEKYVYGIWPHFLNVGVSSALVYDENTGLFYRADYTVREHDVFVSDFYEVEIVRVTSVPSIVGEREEKEMDKEVVKEEAAEIVTETKVVAEVTLEETPETEEVKENASNVQAEAIGVKDIVYEVKDQTVTIDNTSPQQPISAEAVEDVEKLKARIAELEEVEKKWLASEEALRVAAVAAKKEKLTNYAKVSGLDLSAEIVASAVEAMDYEKLVSLVLEAQKTEPEAEEAPITAPDNTINPLTSDMKLKGNWLFDKAE